MVLISESEGEQFEFSGQTIWKRFVNSVEHHADNIAIVCTHQPAGHLNLPNTNLDNDVFQQNPYLRVKYRHLGDAINRLSNALLSHGVGPGTPIFTFMPNLIEFTICMWAAIKIGATFVPINPRNILNRQEVDHMIKIALSWKASESAVVFAGDSGIAQGVDDLQIPQNLTKILISTEKKAGWLNFAGVLQQAPTTHPQNLAFEISIGNDPTMIVFTSGTTSLPKGIAKSADRFSYFIEQRCVRSRHTSDDVVCIPAPNNHGVYLTWLFAAHGHGGAVVHAGAAFAPQDMLDTLVRESCTHVGLVPTMVHGLVAAKAGGGGRTPSLRTVGLGGSITSPDVIDHCLHDLGASNVENVWGMTEGCITSSNNVPIHTLIDGDKVSVGFAAPNTKIRICGPNSRVPLPLGVAGELHFSGFGLTENYIGVKSDDFYTGDDGRLWFVTGDQATLDEQGRIFMTGRYKEMIIRGGENIAPAAIEAVLSKVPEIAPLIVQIVGAKDSIAGEVPVAVYKGATNLNLAQLIQQTALNKIGPAHVPDQVISLGDLGLDDFPRTMAGKIQKTKLAALTQEFRDREEQTTSTGNRSNDDLADVVRKIWKRALGYEIDENVPFASFADSITVMKTRDMITKEIGKQISLTDMVEANTISGQIKLLQQQDRHTQISKVRQAQREGVVTASDVVLFRQNPSAFDTGKIYIEEVLSKYDLGWNDVADIMPAYDFGTLFNQTGIMDTWSVTIGLMTKVKSVAEARQALSRTLTNNPILISFFVWNREAFQTQSALHVVMKHTDRFLQQRIHDFGRVKTVEDVRRFAQNYPVKNAAVLPGPLFDAGVVFVEETQTAAILMVVHHAGMDASSSILFFDDLDNAFSSKPLPIHIDYKVWADSYYSLRNSLDAQRAVKWHVDRLRGASTHRKAFFIDPEGPRAREDPISTSFEVPSILTLRRTHSAISAPVILKSAFALTCTYLSGHTHAMFPNLQASRASFPFIPESLSTLTGHDYSAADVAGPTIETVINLVDIQPQESILSFFTRMQHDQDELTKHAGAPLRDIIDQLGEDTDGAIVLETLKNFNFNWVPGMGSRTLGTLSRYENFETLAFVAKPNDAFALNAGLGGENGSTMMIDYVGTVMTQEQHREFAALLEKITVWMVDERNWEREVAAFKECLA